MADESNEDGIDLSEFESTNSGTDKEKIYSKVPHSDYKWLEEKADQLGGTKSEVIRRLLYQARLKDSDGELIGL